MFKQSKYRYWFSALLAVAVAGWLPIPAQAQPEATATQTSAPANTLETLGSLINLKTQLQKDIENLDRQVDKAPSEAEKAALRQQADKLKSDLRTVSSNFENIAAGVEISSLRSPDKEKLDFQAEVMALLRPLIDEMKDMTARVRQKSDLKEKISFYEERLPVIEQAIANIDRLAQQSNGNPVRKALEATADEWKKQQAFMQSERQAAELQLDKLVASEGSLAETSQAYLKSFFERRGLYLTEALLVALAIMLASRLSYSALQRYVPGFRKAHRSFRVRLVELIHRLLTLLFLILGPMAVFYIVEDWVLFSLSILLLLGLGWTLRQTLPHYWSQVQIFLNIGSVREGERIYLEGLPWLVQQINIFCTLVNPAADISQRVHIGDLADLKSRPFKHDEPWFPCRKGDWVILSDGVRGKVTGISPELVQLVERGGTQLTYNTGDFLAKSPRNLATNFRIKETLGISYNLQKESTNTIPETLHHYIEKRINEEGYGAKLVNLRVEFAQAGNSSLDLVVIADFKGELGDLYNRLRRAIQRWCVDACTNYGWEIPFPQLTIHGPYSTEI